MDSSLLFVRSILRLASELGMKVVAEGIETEDQLRKLQDLDCNIGQGYFFSRPLPRDEATRLLENSFAAVSCR
tara:strand:- start:206 stop:424 length:219 start_codon:yes stop_codon:yes gene_type:complete